MTSGGVIYGAPSAIGAGVTPPASPWVVMPSGTDLVVRGQLRSNTDGISDVMGGSGFTTDVTLHPGSYGNNVPALNA